jgi:hypothetical protein
LAPEQRWASAVPLPEGRVTNALGTDT